MMPVKINYHIFHINNFLSCFNNISIIKNSQIDIIGYVKVTLLCYIISGGLIVMDILQDISEAVEIELEEKEIETELDMAQYKLFYNMSKGAGWERNIEEAKLEVRKAQEKFLMIDRKRVTNKDTYTKKAMELSDDEFDMLLNFVKAKSINKTDKQSEAYAGILNILINIQAERTQTNKTPITR
jgi:hypothetical protein